jgi:hypothetical protein
MLVSTRPWTPRIWAMSAHGSSAVAALPPAFARHIGGLSAPGDSRMNKLFFHKMWRFAVHKLDATIGRLYPLENTLQAMALRPFELHLELTNICNANCIFCPYQHQIRPHQYMSDEVFEKALADYVAEGGGSIILTPIVGDFLIDRKCIDRIRRARSFSCIVGLRLLQMRSLPTATGLILS